MKNIQESNSSEHIFQSKDLELRKSSSSLSLQLSSWNPEEPSSLSTQDVGNSLSVPEEDYVANEVIVKYQPWASQSPHSLDSLSIEGDIRVKPTFRTFIK